MTVETAVQRTLEALMRSNNYEGEEEEGHGPGLTIAVSRQPGSRGATIARQVGEMLGWSVYDRELLQQIAEQTGVRVKMLESMDERHGSWLRDSVESFLSLSRANDTLYLHHLIETIASLAAHGKCVIVGRGAAQFLPPATTLRVRIVGERNDRIEHFGKELGLSKEVATQQADQMERERVRFVREHFNKDPSDPMAHDLVLNSSRFSNEECAAMIAEAARKMQARLKAPAR